VCWRSWQEIRRKRANVNQSLRGSNPSNRPL
jgi:hypothetical protein